MRAHAALLTLAALLVACTPEPDVPPTEVKLRIAPLEVDFGEVLLGSTVTRTLTLVNDGEGPYDPATPPTLGGAAAGAFALGSACAFPLAPSALCELDVSFSPVNPGPHAASVSFDGAGAAELKGSVGGVTVSVEELDFGVLLPGEVGRQSFTITNVGSEGLALPLLVTGDAFSARGPSSLAAGATATVEVLFEPVAAGEALGTLSVDVCNTPVCENPSLALRGVAARPSIAVTPAQLDFGTVALGATVDATIVVRNVGDAPLVVESTALTDVSGNLSLVDGPTLPATLAPGEEVDVIVRNAPAQGVRALEGSVRIASTDAGSPVVTVPITGSTPGAGVVPSPNPIEFGIVDEGVTRDIDVTLTSSGDGPAIVTSVALADPSGPFTVHGLPTLPVTLDPGTAITFVVRAVPRDAHLDGVTDGLVIGLQGLTNRIVPVTLAGGASGCDASPLGFANIGRLSLGATDSASVGINNRGTSPCILAGAALQPGPRQDEVTFDASGASVIPPGETREIVFIATPRAFGQISASVEVSFSHVADPVVVSGLAFGVDETFVAEPTALDLGSLPEQCSFGSFPLDIVNQGLEPATIESVSLIPPDAPFVATAALPGFVPAGGRFALEVTRLAAALGHHTATLRVRSNLANTVFIPLSLDVAASGTATTERFAASNFTPIDILFVVDNSGSMADNQARLVENFQRFIDQPAIANDEVDFHIGVTTTDTFAEAGRLVGVPAVITNDTPDLASVFTANASVGVNGSGSEAGLEASRLALSEPNLSGANAGFLRDEAALVVIYVSDEEDQSPLSVADYVSFFSSVKPSGVSVSAVAAPSTRYQTITNLYGGLRLDISSPDWGEQLGQLGAQVFATSPPQQLFYRLSATIADPNSIQVTVDGAPVTMESVDVPRRVIRLTNAAADGSIVEVTYVPDCQ